MKKYQSFLSENFQFLEMKFSIYLNRRVFVLDYSFARKQLSGDFCVFINTLSECLA